MKKFKNFCIKFMLFLLLSLLADFIALDYNGFLGFALWVIFMIILVKAPYQVSLIVMLVAFVIQMFLSGAFMKIAESGILFYIILIVVGYLYMRHRSKIDKVVNEKRKAGETPCPRCGSSRTYFVQGYADTHTEYDYDRKRDIVKTTYNKGYWKCQDCNHQFH